MSDAQEQAKESNPIAEAKTARDAVAAAYDELSSDTPKAESGDAEPKEAAEAAEYQPDDAPKAEEPQEAPQAPQPKEGRQPNGQFAKGDPKKREITPAPVGWKGDAKVEWNRLPKHVREALAEDYASRAALEQRAQAFDQVLTPARRQQLQMAYGDDIKGLNQILATVEYSNQDPEGFVKWFIGQRRLDMSRLVPAQQPQESGYTDPALAAVQSELSGLKQLLHSQQQSQQITWQSQRALELNGFLADSVNYPYANDVFDDMMALISTRRAADLKDAYDKAVYANPVTRAKVLAAGQQQQLQAQAQKAAEKKAVASSIAGAPGGVGAVQSQVLTVNGRPETATETLRRVMEQQGARF